MRKQTISPEDKVIDSRDVESRIDDLQSEQEALKEAVDEAKENLEALVAEDDQDKSQSAQELVEQAEDALGVWESENLGELNELKALKDEVFDCVGEWSSGVAIINEDYWEDYVRKLVSNIGDMPRNIPSYIEIDWGKTAENVAQDYITVGYGGKTFYVRN